MITCTKLKRQIDKDLERELSLTYMKLHSKSSRLIETDFF